MQKINKSKIFFLSSFSFLVGILEESFFPFSKIIHLEIIVSILFLWLIIYLFANKKAKISIVLIFFLFLGVFRVQLALKEINQGYSFNQFSQKGIIVNDPIIKNNYQNLIVLTQAKDQKNKNQKIKILIKTSKYPHFQYGDKINYFCQPRIPQNFSSDFDYKMFLAKDKIYYVCLDNHIKIIQSNQGNFVYSFLLKTKKKLEKNINEKLPQPEAALASGLLLGGSHRMSLSLQKQFSQTGMSHIVAVSGFNVTIIANYLILLGIFLGFNRKNAFWLALLGIFSFIVLIGWPASAVRAGIMSSFLLWAIKKGRLGNAINVILLAVVGMLLFNPLLLRWDVGFQLSFLATLGLILWAPLGEKYFLQKHKTFGFGEIFFLTLVAQIFVLPIIFSSFHNFSPLSLLANLLILSVLPLTVGLVFLLSISVIFFPFLTLFFEWLSYLLLHYIIIVIKTLSSWGVVYKINNFSWYFFLLWYIILFVFYFLLTKNKIKDR